MQIFVSELITKSHHWLYSKLVFGKIRMPLSIYVQNNDSKTRCKKALKGIDMIHLREHPYFRKKVFLLTWWWADSAAGYIIETLEEEIFVLRPIRSFHHTIHDGVEGHAKVYPARRPKEGSTAHSCVIQPHTELHSHLDEKASPWVVI